MGRLLVWGESPRESLRRRWRRVATAAAAAAVCALVTSGARAATHEWTDPTSGNWSTDDFWFPGPPPNNGGNSVDLVFYTDAAAPSSYVANNDLNDPYNLHSVVFRNFAERDISLSGNALRFTGTNPFIRMDWTGENAILNPIELAATTTFSNTFDGGLLLLAGAISGTGGLDITAGSLHVSGANTYSGETVLSGGTLYAAATNTLSPNSNVVLSGFGQALFLAIDSPLAINGTTIAAGNYSQSIGGLSGVGSIELGQATLTIGGNNTSTTFDGQINGGASAALTKVGSGTLTLTSDITVPRLNINAGRVAPRADPALSAVQVNLAVNNGLDLTDMTSVTTGGLTGSGSLDLAGATLTVNSIRPETYSGAISGTGSLIKGGGAVLELSGTSTFTGGVLVNGSSLRITQDAALGAASAPVSLASGGALEFGGNFNLSNTRAITLLGSGAINTGAFNTTISQPIGEQDFSSALRKLGSGTLTLAGDNTFTAGLTVSQGTVVLAHSGGAGTGDITVNDGITDTTNTALLLPQGVSLPRDITVAPSAGQTTIGSLAAGGGSSTFAGAIALNRGVLVQGGAGGITRFDGAVSGVGAMVINGPQAVQFRGGAKTYAGQTDIASSGGLLSVATAAASPVNSTIRVQTGATLSFEGISDATIGGLLGTGIVTTNAAIGPSSVRIGNNNDSTTFFGTILGAMSVEKIGAGTLVLAGSNDYAGPTTFSGGTLQVASGSNLGNGDATNALVFNGGTLRTTGSFSTNRALTVSAGGGTIDATGQTLTLSGAASVNGSLTIAGGAVAVGNVDGTGSTNVNAGATLIADRVRQTNLNVDGIVRVRASGADGSTTVLNSLSIAPSGVLDLNDNDLIVNYETTSPFASLRADVFRGFSIDVDPARPGIISSTSQNSSTWPILALFDNAIVGMGSFNNISIDPTTVVGKYTYWGDVNLDGEVGLADYAVITANMNTTPDARDAWLKGDATMDGLVTGDDYAVVDSNLFLGVGGNPLSASAVDDAVSQVPEPGVGSMLIGALAGLLATRRRK